jgi:hypothetical protein
MPSVSAIRATGAGTLHWQVPTRIVRWSESSAGPGHIRPEESSGPACAARAVHVLPVPVSRVTLLNFAWAAWVTATRPRPEALAALRLGRRNGPGVAEEPAAAAAAAATTAAAAACLPRQAWTAAAATAAEGHEGPVRCVPAAAASWARRLWSREDGGRMKGGTEVDGLTRLAGPVRRVRVGTQSKPPGLIRVL